jgi:hypothetical protein
VLFDLCHYGLFIFTIEQEINTYFKCTPRVDIIRGHGADREGNEIAIPCRPYQKILLMVKCENRKATRVNLGRYKITLHFLSACNGVLLQTVST